MDTLHLSGVGSSKGLVISMAEALHNPAYAFLYPDVAGQSQPADRSRAAARWNGLTIAPLRASDPKATAFFEDATGPGFSLPGCTLCVSERVRDALGPALEGQAVFLPIEIRGAPEKYWIFYVTNYYTGIDLHRSVFRDAPSYSQDRRRELRSPVFVETPELKELLVFRVPSSSEFVPFALGDFATQRFKDLVIEAGLSGFSFIRVRGKGELLRPGEPAVFTSKGPKYPPAW